MSIRGFTCARVFSVIILVLSAVCIPSSGADSRKVTFVFTSNLEGSFSSVPENQEQTDPMIAAYRTVRKEIRERDAFYYDLGNSLYPGSLSKYSFGSVVIDYFRYSGCRGTLVSSKDLMLGSDNLSFLSRSGKVSFLSANIHKDGAPMFVPFDIIQSGSVKIGIIGMSSSSVVVGIAEKKAYNVSLGANLESLASAITQAKTAGADVIMLLSGMKTDELFEALNAFPEIGIVVSGGDNRGHISNGIVGSLKMNNGRTVVFLPALSGVYRMKCSIDGGFSVDECVRLEPVTSDDYADSDYRRFVGRVSRWKKHYRRDANLVIIPVKEGGYTVDLHRLGGFLRARYSAEISLLNEAITPAIFNSDATLFDVLSLVTDNYPIFTYELNGVDLKKVIDSSGIAEIGGNEKKTIQGYEILDTRMYRVVSTQPVHEDLEKFLTKKVPYKNRWSDIGTEITNDVIGDKLFLRPDFAFVDRIFRGTCDLKISFFRQSTSVSKGENVNTPPGKTEKGYKTIGTEDKADLTVYNRYHSFILTPYVYYIREDDEYLQNLFRCTFLYTFNLHPVMKPYNKFQMDTQLVKTDGLRPTVIRETTGVYISTSLLTGRVGTGFEKETKDPIGPYVFGVESIIGFKYTFFKNFTYSLNVDSFISVGKTEVDDESEKKGYSRTSVETALSYAIDTNLSLTMKYKCFDYYSMGYRERYRNTQVITSLDVITDFKVW